VLAEPSYFVCATQRELGVGKSKPSHHVGFIPLMTRRMLSIKAGGVGNLLFEFRGGLCSLQATRASFTTEQLL